MSKSFKALSLHQPWGSYIAGGHKQFETRSWTTKHRGTLMIHAARTWSGYQKAMLLDYANAYPELNVYNEANMYRGCIIAAVQLLAIYRVEDIRDQLTPKERTLGDYSNGRFAWHMRVLKLPEKPIPATGARGLWTWEVPAEHQV